jgi:signal transduction histidine kinase
VVGQYRDRRGAQGVIGMLAGAAIWSGAAGIRLAALTRWGVLLWNPVSPVTKGGGQASGRVLLFADVTGTEIIVLSSVVAHVWNTLSPPDGTFDTDVSTAVDADPGRLRQCFENILQNCVEHGGPDVTVTVGGLDNGFYITDSGSGFREAALGNGTVVVDYYAQEGRYGLQIVENVVEAHGWDLTVGNGENGGARFGIRTA